MTWLPKALLCSALPAAALLACACNSCSAQPGVDAPNPVVDGGDASSDSSDGLHDTAPDSADVAEGGGDDAADGAANPGDCGPFDRPAAVPANWEEYTGWSCGCRLYVPGKTGQMPAPIEWEDCSSPVPQSLTCRWMRHTWRTNGIAESVFPKASFDRDTGKVLLQFTRAFVNDNPDMRHRLVAEADGPVRVAIAEATPWDKGCGLRESGVAGNRYLFGALGDTWDGPITGPGVDVKEGFIGGYLDDTSPTTVRKQNAPADRHTAWAMSEDWIIEWTNSQKVWTWDLSTSYPLYDPAQDPDHLLAYTPTVVGKDIFVEVGELAAHGEMSWTLADRLRPLVRYIGDASRIAANFGTDGTDMVWTYGDGPQAGTYTKLDVMTAPYTTDPATAQATARRVRSDLKGAEPDGYAVGCGYAARAPGLYEPSNNALFIVRLADGVSWLLPGHNDVPGLSWGAPLVITCDEVFGTVTAGGNDIHIYRIRLDSLGPGTPPD